MINILIILIVVLFFILCIYHDYVEFLFALKKHPHRRGEIIKRPFFKIFRTLKIYQKSKYFRLKVFYLAFFIAKGTLDFIFTLTKDEDKEYQDEYNNKKIMNIISKITPFVKKYLILKNLGHSNILFIFYFYYLICCFILLYYEFKFLSFVVDFPEIINDLMEKKIYLREKEIYLHKALEINMNFLRQNDSSIMAVDNELTNSIKRCYNFIFFIPIFFNLVPKAKISFLRAYYLIEFTKNINAFKYNTLIKNRIYHRLRSNILNFDLNLSKSIPKPNDINLKLITLYFSNIKTIYYILMQDEKDYCLLKNLILENNLQLISIYDCLNYSNIILNLY